MHARHVRFGTHPRSGPSTGAAGAVTPPSRRHRRQAGAEIGLAAVVTVVAFLVVALVGTVARPHVPVPVLGLLFLAGVLAVARYGGVVQALPVAIVTLTAYDWYVIPPIREVDGTTVAVLAVYVVTSLLIAETAARADRRADASEQARTMLAEEQAALRRVAMLVARGLPPDEVFTAVAQEVGSVLGADATTIVRVDADGAVTVLTRVGDPPGQFPVGSHWTLEPPLALAVALRTGRPARNEDFSEVTGAYGARVRRSGIRSGIAAPIIVDGRLWGGVASGTRRGGFPAGTEQRLAGFTELLGTAIANADSRAQLSASRARIVTAADDARRRIERDLHDGTQQGLVTLGLELRLAQATVPADLPELRGQIAHVADELDRIGEELRRISHGIHPAILSEGGLGPALRTLARRTALPVELDIRTDARPADPIEVAAYYVVSEALTNATKHAHASYAHVTVERCDSLLRLSIRDDGVGGADPEAGSGLIGLRDRVQALGGSIEVSSPPGAGTTIVAELPLEPVRPAPPGEPAG